MGESNANVFCRKECNNKHENPVRSWSSSVSVLKYLSVKHENKHIYINRWSFQMIRQRWIPTPLALCKCMIVARTWTWSELWWLDCFCSGVATQPDFGSALDTAPDVSPSIHPDGSFSLWMHHENVSPSVYYWILSVMLLWPSGRLEKIQLCINAVFICG